MQFEGDGPHRWLEVCCLRHPQQFRSCQGLQHGDAHGNGTARVLNERESNARVERPTLGDLDGDVRGHWPLGSHDHHIALGDLRIEKKDARDHGVWVAQQFLQKLTGRPPGQGSSFA